MLRLLRTLASRRRRIGVCELKSKVRLPQTTIGISIAAGTFNYFFQKYLRKLDKPADEQSIAKASVPLQEPLEQGEETVLPLIESLEQEDEKALKKEEDALPLIEPLEQGEDEKALKEEVEALTSLESLEQEEEIVPPSLDSLEQEESTPAVEGFTSSNSEE